MKHEFIAHEDVEQRVGDVLLVAKKGEKLLLSSREAEAAAAGGLEYVGPVTETESEAELVIQTTAETRESLLKLKRDQLIEKAASLGIAVNSDTKDELATAILAKNDEIALGNGSESDAPAATIADPAADVENSDDEVNQ